LVSVLRLQLIFLLGLLQLLGQQNSGAGTAEKDSGEGTKDDSDEGAKDEKKDDKGPKTYTQEQFRRAVAESVQNASAAIEERIRKELEKARKAEDDQKVADELKKQKNWEELATANEKKAADATAEVERLKAAEAEREAANAVLKNYADAEIANLPEARRKLLGPLFKNMSAKDQLEYLTEHHDELYDEEDTAGRGIRRTGRGSGAEGKHGADAVKILSDRYKRPASSS
jgi:hypothetical protein